MTLYGMECMGDLTAASHPRRTWTPPFILASHCLLGAAWTSPLLSHHLVAMTSPTNMAVTEPTQRLRHGASPLSGCPYCASVVVSFLHSLLPSVASSSHRLGHPLLTILQCPCHTKKRVGCLDPQARGSSPNCHTNIHFLLPLPAPGP